MNIFYLHRHPKTCAQYHVDKHVVKMIVEYAQLLSTAHRVLDGKQVLRLSATGRKVTHWQLEDEREGVLYKATHINHPCAVWTRQSDKQYQWLGELLACLLEEYQFRYGKVHLTQRLLAPLQTLPVNIPQLDFSEPPSVMLAECKVEGDAQAAYQQYYRQAKSHLLAWKNRPVPEWLTG